MITREQVADLQPGDFVKLEGYPSLKGAAVAGPAWSDGETQKLCVGPFVIRHRDGTAPVQYDDDPNFSLTVVSRAPRPLYVNHPRTVALPSDVVRDEDGAVWLRDDFGKWISADSETDDDRLLNWNAGTRPTLLVDGETGQVVQ